MFSSILFAMPVQTLPMPQGILKLKILRGNTFTTQTSCKLKDGSTTKTKREGRGKGRAKRGVQVKLHGRGG